MHLFQFLETLRRLQQIIQKLINQRCTINRYTRAQVNLKKQRLLIG